MSLPLLLMLALVEGVAEPLPVSAGAHLCALAGIAGWPGLSGVDLLAALIGVLAATAACVAPDLWRLVRGVGEMIRGRPRADAWLIWQLFFATLPAVAVTVAWPGIATLVPQTLPIIGWSCVGFGLLLAAGDRLGMTIRRIEHIQALDALILGVAQIITYLPGASRACVTMTAGRLLGLERGEAARFSWLMSLPALGGMTAALAWRLKAANALAFAPTAPLVGVVAALGTLLAILWLRGRLQRRGYLPLALYRIALGALLLAWSYRLSGVPFG